jgi:hypothetical protein
MKSFLIRLKEPLDSANLKNSYGLTRTVSIYNAKFSREFKQLKPSKQRFTAS